jgi:hypothetical protein
MTLLIPTALFFILALVLILRQKKGLLTGYSLLPPSYTSDLHFLKGTGKISFRPTS